MNSPVTSPELKTFSFDGVQMPAYREIVGKHDALRLRELEFPASGSGTTEDSTTLRIRQANLRRIRVFTPVVEGEHDYEDSRALQRQLNAQVVYDAKVSLSKVSGIVVQESRPQVNYEKPTTSAGYFNELIIAAREAAVVIEREIPIENAEKERNYQERVNAGGNSIRKSEEYPFLSGRKFALAQLPTGQELNLTFFVHCGVVTSVHVFPRVSRDLASPKVA